MVKKNNESNLHMAKLRIQSRQDTMITEKNVNGILIQAEQVRLQHEHDEEMYSESENNECKSIKTRQTSQ